MSKALSLVRTILLATLLTITILAQGVIIKQNEIIGKEVAWISFLVEGDKKREKRPIDNPRSPRALRHYKVNTGTCNEFINTL